MGHSIGNNRENKTRSHRKKKDRGGQAGNRNAFKHGLYSKKLTGEEIAECRRIVETENIDPELALLRLRLANILENDPSNASALRAAAGEILKHCKKQAKLDGTDACLVRLVIESALSQAALIYMFKNELSLLQK